MTDIWTWQSRMLPDDDRSGTEFRRELTGFEVEATDGAIGKIDEATADVDRGHLVVDTGWWIFGKKRLVPAGLVAQIDDELQKVFVSCSKEEIKGAPDYDDSTDAADNVYRTSVGDYYSRRTHTL